MCPGDNDTCQDVYMSITSPEISLLIAIRREAKLVDVIANDVASTLRQMRRG